MLLRFRFSNFRSFCAEQELSLIAGASRDHSDVVQHPAGIREGVLPVAAIYGANASGKTNVIRAFEFMASAVRSSHRIWEPEGPIPRDPFLADKESSREPSGFEVDFLQGGVRRRYGFRIDSEAVLEEWLYAYPRGKKQTWFHRTRGSPTTFSAKMAGENRTIENLTRRNSLFLSAAAQNSHETLLPIYKWLTGQLFVTGDRSAFRERTAKLFMLPDYTGELVRLFSGADLGITGVKVRGKGVSGDQFDLRFWHQFGDKAVFGDKVVIFEADRESDGTMAYFSLLGPAIEALKDGSTLFIDEIDASLHPLLAIQLIRVFNDPSSNRNGAQLIFNTHDTNLLNNDFLRRDQIWFTEKNKDASSHLYPLSDFKPRKKENLQSGYLQGRYGAIPFINSDAFLLSFEANNGKA